MLALGHKRVKEDARYTLSISPFQRVSARVEMRNWLCHRRWTEALRDGQGEVWKAQGKRVADPTPYLPGSFDRPPRNPETNTGPISASLFPRQILSFGYIRDQVAVHHLEVGACTMLQM